MDDVVVDNELLELIFTSALTDEHLRMLSLVCRRWRDVCKSAALRKVLLGGSAFSFGGDTYHQEPLGHPKNTTKAMHGVPTRIQAFRGMRVVDVAAGWQHSLFLTDDGKVYVCGVASEGKLGLGPFNDSAFEPKLVVELEGVVAVRVVAGAFHSLVLTNTGAVYSFGYNRNGRLGLGHSNNQATPALITALSEHRVVQVAGGNMHSMAVTQEGRVFSWGDASSGMLGLPDQTGDVLTPTLVEALQDKRIVSVGAGDFHSLFLTDDGKVYSCGRDTDSNGRLGYEIDKRDNKTQLAPMLIPAFANEVVSVIAAGECHSLVATQDGRLYSFGRNQHGELGLGFTASNPKTSTQLPCLVTALADKKVISMVAASQHSFVITDDGSLYSFGCGDNYRLGQGDCEMRVTPTKIEKLAPFFVRGVSSNGRHALAFM